MPDGIEPAIVAPDGRRARGDVTRSRVLEVALDTASRYGLNGVTIGPVADAAGVSKGHLALLFGNREQLQLATLEAAVALFGRHVMEPATHASTPAAALKLICLGWFDYVRKRILPAGCFVTAVTSEYRLTDGPVRDRLIELRETHRALLRQLIGDARAGRRALPAGKIEEALHDILAYRVAANIAFPLGEKSAFEHALSKTKRIVSELLD